MDSATGDSRKRVLITGAAGRIGSMLARVTAERYRIRLADRERPTIGGMDAEAVALDITDPAACSSACVSIDTVVHLAADPNPGADFESSLLPNNIVGTFNMFRAAADAGCQRMILASSVQVFGAQSDDHQAFEDSPVRPSNVYGAAKCFGEALASCFSAKGTMSCLVVRLGLYTTFHAGEHHSAGDMSCYLSEADCAQLLICCIDAGPMAHAVLHGVSNNRFKRLNISATRELIGYAPVDDAFQILSQ